MQQRLPVHLVLLLILVAAFAVPALADGPQTLPTRPETWGRMKTPYR